MVRTFLTLMKNIEETCESAADICKLQLKALHRAYTLDLGANSDIIQLSLDNKVAIDSSYNPENHARTKHIDRRHYFIRELVEEGQLVVPYVASADNLADFFTKPLKPSRFFVLRDKIMNVQ